MRASSRDQLPEETCPHVHLSDGSCVDCLADVTWPGYDTVDPPEARTRRALARVRLNLALFGQAASPWLRQQERRP